MPHISKYKLSKDQIDQLSQHIINASFLIRDRSDLNLFFGDLLTTTEKIMLGKRLLIAMMIERGRAYMDIRRMLGVSDPTIAIISEQLKKDGRGFRSAIKQLRRKEKIDAILERFGKALEALNRHPRIRL